MKNLTPQDFVTALGVASTVTGALSFLAAQEGGRGSVRLAMRLETAHVVLGALAGIGTLACIGCCRA
jgi:hypothetical protein